MESLKKERRWCVWCLQEKRKIPFAGIGVPGKVDDKTTWLSFERAYTLLNEQTDIFAGMGLYFSPRENDPNMLLCGIDIDAIEHDPNHPNPLAEEILELFKGTYAEESPSGTGYHILCHINTNEFSYKKNNYPFYQKNTNNSIEVYISGITNRYFTYTGRKLPSFSDQITDQTDNVLYLLQRYMLRAPSRKRITSGCTIQPAGTALLSDEEIERRLDRIRQSVRNEQFIKLYDEGDITGYNSPSEADFALLSILVPWLEGDAGSIDIAYRKSALYIFGRNEKWNSRRGNSTYGELSIQNAIELSLDPYYYDSPDYATGDTISPTDIVKIINEVQNEDKVTVIPFACGLGKSTAISYKIAEVLQSESTDGLIVVTDSVERMYQYKAPANTKLATLREYIEAHADEISVMESQNKRTEKKRQQSCKVLIMSTQSYFEYSSRAQIIKYITWEKGKRTLVIIDEKPIVQEQAQIDESVIDKVSRIFDTFVLEGNEQEELEWCISEWANVSNYMKEQSKHYRRLPGDSQYFFFQNEKHQLTSNDVRFMEFVDRHNYVFIREKIYGNIRAVGKMMHTWGIVYRKKEGHTVKVSYYSVNDHRDKITDIGAKVIILDGTATLSQEYDADYFDIRESPACRRLLSRLSIHVIDVLTTKSAIDSADKTKLAASIRDYAWRKNRKKESRSVVFTYKSPYGTVGLEEELEKLFNTTARPNNVAHLGAIRGKNVFRDAGFFIQYGLYRCPPPVYMAYLISNDSELIRELSEDDELSAAKKLTVIEKSFALRRMQSSMILADIEQNFFRGVIRNSDGTELEEYHLFCSLKNLDLLYLMQLRYWPLKAEIKFFLAPKEFEFVKLHREAGPAKLLRWLKEICKPGRVFTYDDVAAETGLTKKHISQIRSRNKTIDALLSDWSKNEDKGYYRKPLSKNRKVNQ